MVQSDENDTVANPPMDVKATVVVETTTPPTPQELKATPPADTECIFAKLFTVSDKDTTNTLSECPAHNLPPNEDDEISYEVSFPMKLETVLTSVIVAMIAITMLVSYSPTLLVSITFVITVICMLALYYIAPSYAMRVLKQIMVATQMGSILLL